MKNNFGKILEYTWLVAAILSFGAAVHQTIYQGISNSWLFTIISAISIAMYFFRRKMRKLLEKTK
jgi:hypothetical protein